MRKVAGRIAPLSGQCYHSPHQGDALMWWIGYHGCRTLSWVSLFAVTVVGGILKTEPTKWGFASDGIAWAKENGWFLVVALSIAGGIFSGVSRLIGPPWLWDAIRRTMNRMREEGFTGIEGDMVHHHRVTLFRRKWCWMPWPWRKWWWPWGDWRWPWSGWMVAVSRSGHTTQQCWTVFFASAEEVDRCEGIVGQVWLSNTVQVQADLPAIDSSSTPEQIAEYARLTVMPIWQIQHRIKRNRPCPRALCGIPVEVNNKIWGVLVLDSRKPDTINYRGRTWQAFTSVVPQTLAELLRGV
jgi:hypothetical protein